MEPEGSLSCPLQATTCLFHELYKLIPRLSIYSLKSHLNMMLPSTPGFSSLMR
jgi:hypothetical protein